ncbi:Myosin phosphatase Rho-interacting protein [Varanus komodoensis]|nr:Myosin phosphatase Rho-interacting protein [Varanus komodoensis]
MSRSKSGRGRKVLEGPGAEIKAKPIYGGWLLLAPEGTDFDNPVHRSRKWQRRFFILYEHGLLRYALDEMVSHADASGHCANFLSLMALLKAQKRLKKDSGNQ